jgi:hypothetical protein
MRVRGTVVAAFFLSCVSVFGQWITESYSLKAGWNGVWLPLDASYGEIQDVITNPQIEQVWRWNPPVSPTQFTTDPQTPVPDDVQWSVWKRAQPVAPFSTFFTLTSNAAYLIKVADSVGTGTISLAIKGKPVPPRYPWKESGVNFFGFSTLPSGAPNFETFFSHSPTLKNNVPIFLYPAGAGLDPTPTRVVAPRNTSVTRGQGYWIQSTGYTDYYGPLKLTASSGGFDFGSEGYAVSMRIKNVTAASLTATLSSVNSEAPPTVAPPLPAVAGVVPLDVRGQFNPTTGQYAYSSLPHTISLAAGEETEVVLSLRRGDMGTTAGAVFQSLVRVTDSLGLTRTDLPARAVTTSLAGLWIGTASIDSVDQVVGATATAKPAPAPFTLRFLVHMNGSGSTTLLQQAYIGQDTGGTRILAAKQSALDQTKIESASRVSTANFPLDLRVPNGGALGLTGSASFTVPLAAGAATNPFLHIYHPDHGVDKSYSISRAITLTFASSVPGLNDPTFGSTTLGGTYAETISGLRATPLQVSGTFVLHRISDLSNLVTTP